MQTDTRNQRELGFVMDVENCQATLRPVVLTLPDMSAQQLIGCDRHAHGAERNPSVRPQQRQASED